MIDRAEAVKQATEISLNISEEFKRKNIDPNIAQASVGSLWSTMVHIMGWSKADFLECCIKVANVEWDD